MSVEVGTLLANEAIERVERNADSEWKDGAYLACCLVAESLIEFTTDDVWEYMERLFPNAQTHEPRAMGAIMRKAARDGKIVPTGEYAKSSRSECHSRPVMIWESLIFEDEDF